MLGQGYYGVYPNKMPVSQGRSPRVRAFCSDVLPVPLV